VQRETNCKVIGSGCALRVTDWRPRTTNRLPVTMACGFSDLHLVSETLTSEFLATEPGARSPASNEGFAAGAWIRPGAISVRH